MIPGGGDNGKPLQFGIQVEGTDDRLIHRAIFESGGKKDSALAVLAESLAGASGAPSEANMHKYVETAALTVAKRDLPVLVARFKTAHVLVAFRSRESKVPELTPRMGFDETLDRPLSRMRSWVELDIRVLNRNGAILDTRTVRGECEQLVVESMH